MSDPLNPTVSGVQSSGGEDWETLAKDFQSKFDREYANNQRLNGELTELSNYKELREVLENRPDVVDAMKVAYESNLQNEYGLGYQEPVASDNGAVQPHSQMQQRGGQPATQSQLTSADVQRLMKTEFDRFQRGQAINTLKSRAQNEFGLNSDQAKDFISFVEKPTGELPIEVLVDVFTRAKGLVKAEEPTVEPIQQTGVDIARLVQNSPQTAGVLQSDVAHKPNEADSVIKSVLNAIPNGGLP